VKSALSLIATYIVVFMQMLDTSIVALALPRMASGLQIDVYDSVWIMTSFGIGIASAFAMVKIVSAQFGVNLTFKYSMLVFIAFSVACGWFDDIYYFLFCRYFQGLSSGFLVLLSQSIFIKLLGNDKRAMAFSMWGSAVAIAPVLGPFVGGVMTEKFGWESLFFVNLPIITFSYLILDRQLQADDKPEASENINFSATIWLVVFIIALQLAIDFGEKYHWFESNYIVILFALAIVALLSFFYTNNRGAGGSTALDFSVFKHREFAIFALLGALGHGIVFASLIYLPTWLQASYGMPIIESGVVVAIGGIATFLVSPMVGKIRSPKHHYLLLVTALLLIAISFLAMTTYKTDSSLAQLVVPRLLMGVGLAMFYSPLSSISFAKLSQTEIVNANAILLILRVVITNICMSFTYQLMRIYMHSAYQETAVNNMNSHLPELRDTYIAQYYWVMNSASTQALQQIFYIAFVAFVIMFLYLTPLCFKQFSNHRLLNLDKTS